MSPFFSLQSWILFAAVSSLATAGPLDTREVTPPAVKEGFTISGDIAEVYFNVGPNVEDTPFCPCPAL